MGYGYPGGPIIEELAQKALQIPFPNFKKTKSKLSFSGLKTAVIREIIKCKTSEERYWQNNIAASLQNTISILLASKIRDAIILTGTDSLVVSGGVAANNYIRGALSNLCKTMQVKLRVPPKHLCADNGLMIAWAACLKSLLQKDYRIEDLKVRPRWKYRNERLIFIFFFNPLLTPEY